MTLPTLLNYLIGYSFSVLLGGWLISIFSRNSWVAIEGLVELNRIYFRSGSYLVGILERLIYTSSIVFGVKEFIAVWLAVKIASQWKAYEGSESDRASQHKARALFNVYLLGTGLSLLYGALGAQIITWLDKQEYILPLISSFTLVTVNLIFIVVVKNNAIARTASSSNESSRRKIDRSKEPKT
jgi:hypothetical protein